MCSFVCGLTTSIIGSVLIVTTSLLTFNVVPGFIEKIVESEVVLIEDTIQMERFEEIPFPLNFTVRFWNISNADEVLSGGIPTVDELGPYVYRVYQKRIIESIDEDLITYKIVEHYEFDSLYSYPNTEEDTIFIANVAYNVILQQAETRFPQLMSVLSLGLNGIFGVNNRPIMEVKVRDLLFDGVKLCENPGIVGAVACARVRELGANAQNLMVQDDGSLSFSLLANKQDLPSGQYVVHRGLQDSVELGQIVLYNNMPSLAYWMGNDAESPSVCNMLNGTDSGLYAPFVDRETPIYALNTDICRSVDLRYQYDLEHQGIPAVRFAVDEMFLANADGCYCLNATTGVTKANGCLLDGVLELFTCVGAYLVLSLPHFLYADPTYRNGVIGMNPVQEEHRIFVDLEPITGTVIRGAKRGQFNVFLRPVTGISATQNLRTTLVPIFWVEQISGYLFYRIMLKHEMRALLSLYVAGLSAVGHGFRWGMSLPEEFANEIRTRLLSPLNMVGTLLPVAIALCAAVTLVGVAITVRANTRKTHTTDITSKPTSEDSTESKAA